MPIVSMIIASAKAAEAVQNKGEAAKSSEVRPDKAKAKLGAIDAAWQKC